MTSARSGWIAVLAIVGCSAEPPPREGTQTQAIEGYIGQQGTLLLGFQAPDIRTFAFSVANTTVDSNGRLSNGVIGGMDYADPTIAITATGPGGLVIPMRFAQVIAPVAPATQWEYVLEQQVSGQWLPACAQPSLVLPPLLPLEMPVRAIAIPGGFTADGGYYTTSSRVTFACRTGVVAKCDAWGYGASAAAPSATVAAADMVQACTRMARADYCATGGPNTLDGTPIHIDDAFHPTSVVKDYAFEAAWPGVASSSPRIETHSPVVCLSKLRWSTLPLGGDCPLQLPDPRVNAKGRFCDDLTPTQLAALGARTFSSSSYIDAGLYTYDDPATDQRLTTSKLVPQAQNQPPAWQITPPANVIFPVANQPAPQFEATILAPVLPAGFTATGLLSLTSYRCDADYLTTTSTPSDASCAPIAFEGWVYPPHTAGRAPLRRWFNPATKHSWTTVTSPTTMILNHWQAAEVVGSVVRASTDIRVWWSLLSISPPATYSIDIELRTGEWINGCLTNVGGMTTLYHGTCANNRAVNHADIVAFRIESSTGVVSDPAAYDGVATDTYVPLAGGTPMAVNVDWNDVGNANYAFDVFTNGAWLRCADQSLIANDTSYFFDGLCSTPNQYIKPSAVSQVRICAFDRTSGAALSCSAATYPANARDVHVSL
jgi:hypothetical protein